MTWSLSLTLSKVGTEKPKERELSFTLKGSAGFAPYRHTLLLLRFQVPILTLISYNQIRPRKCCRCTPSAWTGRQDGLLSGPTPFSFTTQPLAWGLTAAPAAWPSPKRPRTLDLDFLPGPCLQGSFLNDSLKTSLAWYPQSSICMWVLWVKGAADGAWVEQEVAILVLNQRWVCGEEVCALNFICEWHCLSWAQAPTVP